MVKRVCLDVYVSFSMTGRGFSNIHAQTYTLDQHFYIFVWGLIVHGWACMFHFPWQAEGFQTYVHAQLVFSFFETCDFELVCSSVYVWFSMTGSGFSDIHTCLFVDCWWLLWLILLKHVCMSGASRSPPLTNLKRLNKAFNSERFPWGRGPSPRMIVYGLKHTYMLGEIHACLFWLRTVRSQVQKPSQARGFLKHTRLAFWKKSWR